MFASLATVRVSGVRSPGLKLGAKSVPETPKSPPTQASFATSIVSGFKSGNYSVFEDRSEGILSAVKKTGKGDIIAILGKGREDYQDVNGEKIYYSDIEIIRKEQ